MDGELQIPNAWQTIVDDDGALKRLYVLTELAEHPHTIGFNVEAKRELLDAAEEAAAANKLDGFRVLWEISPMPEPVNLDCEAFPSGALPRAEQQHLRRHTDRLEARPECEHA